MKAVTIIYGTEPYLMEKGRTRFLNHFREICGDDVPVRVFQDDAAAAEVAESLEGMSLFGSGSVTIWQQCPFLPVRKGGRSRSKLSQIETWFIEKISHLPEDTGLLFFIKGNMDTGCAFFKQLKPLAEVICGEAVTEKTIMPYVEDYLQQQNKSMTVRARQYMQALFQTWEHIPLLYVFSELEKLCIMVPEKQMQIDEADVQDLFAGTMEKNLFAFMDFFLRRDGTHALPLMDGLFGKPSVFLKNTGYMLSRLRLLLAYKELKDARMGQRQLEEVMVKINKGRSVKYVLYHLQKVSSYWKIEELQNILCTIFTVQLRMRRGEASPEDLISLVCVYCSHKGRV